MSRDESAPSASLGAIASRWTVPICALVGLIVGLIIFMARPAVYESRTLVSVVNPLGSMGDEAALVESDRVLGSAAAALGFVPDLTVEANEVASLLTLTVRASDPDQAATAASQVADSYIRAQTTVAASVASPAIAEPDPVAPSRLAHILIGSILGAGLGAMLTLGRGLRLRIPERAPVEERPEPIRPARRPSELSHQLAGVVNGASADDGRNRTDDDASAGYVGSVGTVQAVASEPVIESLFAADDDIDDATPIAADTSDADDATTNDTTTGAEQVIDLSVDEQTRASEPVVASVPSDRSARPVPHATRRAGGDAERDGDTSSSDRGGASVSAWREPAVTPLPVDPSSGADAASTGPAAIQTSRDRADRTDEITQAVTVAMSVADARLEERLEERLAEQRAADAEKVSSIERHYERQIDALKHEVLEARKQARSAIARLKRLDGDDQHRIGDLEAQAAALEAEISTLRAQLESERINHLSELAKERDAADLALDNARRDFREQLADHDVTSRSSLARSRSEFDELVAAARAEHESALDRQHREYEAALTAERDRRRTDLAKLTQRHREEIAAISGRTGDVEAQLRRQTKDTLAELRQSEKRLTDEVEELRGIERSYRDELVQVRAKLRQVQQKASDTEQDLRDDLTTTRKALASEKQRNAALREDVVRRTAEAHQTVDRAIDERSSQLAELEALMARQRDHAEQRIREANQAAEERVREATQRELELEAHISRLERQLGQRAQPETQTG